MVDKFLYSVDGYTYLLAPVFNRTRSGNIRVQGAEMYNPKTRQYYGYWSRENIPVRVMNRLRDYCTRAIAWGQVEYDGSKYRVKVW